MFTFMGLISVHRALWLAMDGVLDQHNIFRNKTIYSVNSSHVTTPSKTKKSSQKRQTYLDRPAILVFDVTV